MPIDLGGNSYPSYATTEEADAYLAASISAAAWRAADADTKKRALISATRLLNRLGWREGVVPADEQAVADATCELASAMVGGYDPENQATTESNIARQKAGSVEIEYRRTEGPAGFRLPLPVWELVRDLLASASSSAIGFGGSIASGTDGCATATDELWVGQSYPLRDGC